MDSVIVNFLNANYVLSLSMADNGGSWSANCFYALDELSQSLIFISHGNAKHAQLLEQTSTVSGTISAQTKNVAHIQGVQYTGKTGAPEGEAYRAAHEVYYKRFPFARFVRAKLWLLELDFVKYTDNSLGFGKKLVWEREA